MNMNQRWIQRIFCYFLVLLGCLNAGIALAVAADAESDQKLLLTIHDARLESYLLLTDYYNFSANIGDKELLASIREGQSQMEKLISALAIAHDSPDYLAAVTKLREDWLSFQDLLNQNMNDLESLGYHELQLVSQLAQVNVDVGLQLERMYQLVMDQRKVRPAETVAKSRQSAFTMALMMTKYAARSTSNISQVFQGEDPDQTLDMLAKDFDRELQQLVTTRYPDPATNKLLEKAQIKWNFIRSSYLNYNENNVNFVVNRYSRQIIESLGVTDNVMEKS